MLKSTRLRLEMDGYREVITGADLDITNCTSAEHGAYEEGKRKAREDMAERMRGVFNTDPRFVGKDEDVPFLGDHWHPDTRPYVAANLAEHIDKMPNTGDWHGELKQWALAYRGNMRPNPS